ncbi:hypothetical protein PFISCL1PPCAC_12477, partial [Pristionchus fissidentatus]
MHEDSSEVKSVLNGLMKKLNGDKNEIEDIGNTFNDENIIEMLNMTLTEQANIRSQLEELIGKYRQIIDKTDGYIAYLEFAEYWHKMPDL